MAIIKFDQYLDVSKYWARHVDVNALTGRGEESSLTSVANQLIAEKLKIAADSVVVDVGCGGGHFLLSINNVARRIGILPLQEEVQMLSSFYENEKIEFLKGYSHSIPLPSGLADRIVINGVCLCLPDRESFVATATELARLAKPGCKLFLGEHPESDEFTGRQYDDSLVHFLLWSVKSRGIGYALRHAYRMLQALLGFSDYLIYPKRNYFTVRSEVAEIFAAAGWSLLWDADRCLPRTEAGSKQVMIRHDYLFERNTD
ncbi:MULTISPECIES: methyltransferase domain-containing protein [Deefgea]|uniref:Methyltransferase domain-containing protein n=1 Tax=Deefgea chitinilytica TaxID=570276 RepID=A0ABS2C9Z8_9NEIS|nr:MULTISPECIES: methyltransferase domain-containing protein [Deefgea]MBM5570882.1 methyltransferase domain-containing protein [Deefgea chitinilytica]MBM9888111.1 methyltransferase domain-containing protein [Deefgea sp. CFH1-16]